MLSYSNKTNKTKSELRKGRHYSKGLLQGVRRGYYNREGGVSVDQQAFQRLSKQDFSFKRKSEEG